MITTPERVEKALAYLAHTDEPYANAVALCKALEQKRKTVFAMAALASEEKGQKPREWAAYASPEFIQITEDIQNAEADRQLYCNKRQLEQLVVEVYRTESANSRRGNI